MGLADNERNQALQRDDGVLNSKSQNTTGPFIRMLIEKFKQIRIFKIALKHNPRGSLIKDYIPKPSASYVPTFLTPFSPFPVASQVVTFFFDILRRQKMCDVAPRAW